MRRHTRPVPPGAAERSTLRAATRPLAWSALITSVVLSVAVGPAYATPDNTIPDGQVPDSGAHPVLDVNRTLQLPGSTAPAAAPGLSPLAQQLQTKQAEMEQAGERAKQANQEHQAAVSDVALADAKWRATRDRLNTAQTQADADAAEAYKATAGLPPGLTSDLRGFGALSAVTRDDIPGLSSARELLRAQQEERDANQAYQAAIKTEQTKLQEYLAADAQRKRAEQDYLALRQQNADRLAAAEREQELRDQALGRQYVDDGSLTGFAADPKALKAVNVALAQLGKPYVWGAEGPNSFDCSGLMWYSYVHGAGYSLPRVAKDQYYGTQSRTVSRYALLPGDLLFFATNPNDWTTVHHVGMYLGGGKMVHAPHTGDVVKISTVWWSEFFAATRVFGEVVAPAGNGSTPPPSGGGGNPAPSPSRTSRPTPSQTTKPPSTASPSPSGSSSSSAPPSSAPPSSAPPSSAPPSSAPPSSEPPSSQPPSESPSSPPPTSTSPAPKPADSSAESSAPAGGGSTGSSTGTSGSTASTQASSAGSESPASTVSSSSGS